MNQEHQATSLLYFYKGLPNRSSSDLIEQLRSVTVGAVLCGKTMTKKPAGVGRLVEQFEKNGSSKSPSPNDTSGSPDMQRNDNNGTRQSSKKRIHAEEKDSDPNSSKPSQKTSFSDLNKQSTSSSSSPKLTSKNKESKQSQETQDLVAQIKQNVPSAKIKKRSKSKERATSQTVTSSLKTRDDTKRSRSRSREKDDLGKAISAKSKIGSKRETRSKSTERKNAQPKSKTSVPNQSRSRSKERAEVGSTKSKRKSTRSRSKDKEKVSASNDQSSMRKARRSDKNDQEDENAIVEQSEWWAIAKTSERDKTSEQRTWYDVGNEKKAPKRTASGESVPGATHVAPPKEIRAELEHMDYLAQPGLVRHSTYAGPSATSPSGGEDDGRLTPPLLQARHTTSYANNAPRPTSSDLENLRGLPNQTPRGAASPRLNESATSLSRFNESATSNRLHDSGISSALSVESWRDDGNDNYDSRFGERVLDRMLEEDSEVTSQDPSFTSAILAQAGTPALARQEARVLGAGVYRMSGAQGQRANMERPVLSSVNGDESQQDRTSRSGLFTWGNSHGRNNSMQHSSNGILVEATLVEDPVMATVLPEGVEPINQEPQRVSHSREMPVVEGKMFPEQRDGRCMKKVFWCAIISAVLVLAAAAGGVLFYFFGPSNRGSDSDSAPDFQQFVATLPASSQQALEDPASPQSLAFNWLKEEYAPVDYTNAQFAQKFSLATFYFATGGEEWTQDENWLESEDECQWYSNRDDVCDTERNYTALSFPSNNLIGTLPGEISLLDRMLHLNLPSNELKGEIPSQIADLNQLVKLDLSDNQLTGPLPDGLSSLRDSLDSLFLDSNQGINGTIPNSWSLLTNLKQLTLQGTSVSGSVPEGVCTLVRGGLVLTVDCENVLCSCACVCTKSQTADSTGLERLSLLLPNSSVESLSIANTPQARAYSWIGDDPGIDSYNDQRLLQRFALACFYYSTDQNWFDDTLWLSDDHECDWYSDVLEPCQNDTFVTLAMSDHGIDGTLPPEIGLLVSRPQVSSIKDDQVAFVFFSSSLIHLVPHLFLRLLWKSSSWITTC